LISAYPPEERSFANNGLKILNL